MPKQKRFKLAADQIRPLVKGHGGCIASDKITVGGERVGYMVRDRPTRAGDSGWNFMSGTETQAFVDEPTNFEVYDVNTIANYDRDIIPLLDAPPGSAFERLNNTGSLVRCEPPEDDDEDEVDTDLDEGDDTVDASPQWPPPGYPMVDGVHALNESWSITLPGPFARRIEDGALVLWRPGVTIWMLAFNNDPKTPQAQRLADMKRAMSDDVTNVREIATGGLTRLTYRVREDGVASVMALVLSDLGHLQVSIYFDSETDAPVASRLAASITYRA